MKRKKRNRNRIGERNKGRKAWGKGEEEIRGQKRRGKRSVQEGNKRREEKKKSDRKNVGSARD